MIWQTSRRKLSLDRTLVMGILNVTPDSFSDGGQFLDLDAAVRQAERSVTDGADIIDIGGESTRPGSKPVSAGEEIERVVPVIKAIAERIDVAISIDTTKSYVAREAIDAGAEIVNDISGLRFDHEIARVAAETGCGLVLMHSRGSFETMHSEPPAANIIADVVSSLRKSVEVADQAGVDGSQIALDIGIGFGKTLEQNLELIANLDKILEKFPGTPMVVGTSRKSFVGKLLGGRATHERSSGSIASALMAVSNGARIVRVHDVKETVDAMRIADAILSAKDV